jgi:hypothetical protein
MAERNVTEVLLLQVIDEGSTRYSDSTHLWARLDVPGRDDDLVCAVLVLEAAVVGRGDLGGAVQIRSLALPLMLHLGRRKRKGRPEAALSREGARWKI